MSREKTSEPEWVSWLRDQVRDAADFEGVYGRLHDIGITDKMIADALEAVRPRGNALASGALELPPLIRRPPPTLRKLDTTQADIYTLDDFLSAKECAQMTALIGYHLQPSPLSYTPNDAEFRTSQTCMLSHLRSPVAQRVDAKICKTLGIRAEYAEGVQAQRYDVGQQFKPHYDFFTPGTHEHLRFAGVRGNRTWTFMVYLNDGMEGGATRFTELGFAVRPKAGMALLWNNLHADGSLNRATMHCGEPVTSGHKLIITKWFRLLGDGAVFYG